MKLSIALAFAGAAAAKTYDADVQHFKEWMGTHGKAYETDVEELARFKVFKDNLAYINSHNQKADKTYKLGLNHLADMTNEEYRQYVSRSGAPPKRNGSTFLAPGFNFNPYSVDWRKEGYVTPVKNQGHCGSCWAFSTVASLEGQYAKKYGKGALPLHGFSEQQLVDCAGSFGNMGCDGGEMDFGFEYIKSLGAKGLDTEASYPYTAADGVCKASSGSSARPAAIVTGHVDVTSGSEADLETAAATVGPMAVAIDASHMSFQFYKSGIYNEPACSTSQLDHGVTVVGYGVLNGKNYWIVKNSWGINSWGEEGYIWMSKDDNNQCGIATSASYPLV